MEKKNAEATTLQRKKTTINKAKVKKTIKNTLCRPDPVFWPTVTEEQAKVLEATLAIHKVEIPEFNKPHWKELKSIPKDQRPKQPKIKKIDGLIFGINQCTEAIKNNQCSAVIIESSVNPQAIVQPLIKTCISNKIPVVCLNGLRKITSLNFGIPTSSLTVKTGLLSEVSCKIEEIAKSHKVPKSLIDEDIEKMEITVESPHDKLEVKQNKEEITTVPNSFTYLYRSSKSTRVFNPSQEEPKAKKVFIGQDFIEFTEKTAQKPDSKAYMSMILKKITNNQNRTKKK